jgi:DNA-binding winged helix-turn-helix (wHTH) protein
MEKLRAKDLVLETELRNILEAGEDAEYAPDFSMFKDTTRRLLTELWHAPDRMLSHQDIREDVMHDEVARDGTVREAIRKARRELRNVNCVYSIETIRVKGYKLVVSKTPPNVTNVTQLPKTPSNKRKNCQEKR